MLVTRCALSVLPFALLLPAASDGGHMTVLQVLENREKLDGKLVTVRGWLPRCEGYDCLLYDSQEAAEADLSDKRSHRYLGIGDSPEFDKNVAGQLPAFVVLRAKFDAECVEPSGWICLDRVADLTQVKILKLDSR